MYFAAMKKLALLAIFLPLIYTVFCQYPEIHFDQIADQMGLHDLWIKCLLQDNRGFIWIGGENGLYRYDGYNIINYKDPPGCKNCPHFYPVYDVVQDNVGMLWIISFNGVMVYDPENERSWIVHRFRSANLSSGSNFKYSRKLDLNKDSKGDIWATGDMGLIRFSYVKDFELKKMKFEKDPEMFLNIDFFQLSTDKNPNKNIVIKIYTDAEGNIWAGCEDGLYVLRKGDTGFHRFEIEVETKAISRTYVNDILQQNKDTFWILSGTANYMVTNIKEALIGSELHFTNLVVAEDLKKIQFDFLLYKDRKNNIILSADNILKFNGCNEQGDPIFEPLFNLNPEKVKNLFEIQSIIEDRSGMMWLAHQRTGVSKFNPDRSRFIYYQNSARYNLTVLQADLEGNLWLGDYTRGLYRIRKETGLIKCYDLGLYGNQIVCLKEIVPGIFWVGTQKEGVLEFNSFTGKFHDPLPEGRIAQNLRHTQVNDIFKDQNQIYFTSSQGIFVYDLLKKKLGQFSYPDDSSYYLANWTISPLKLKNGEIIVFTSFHGINKTNYDPDKGSLTLTCIIPDSVLRSSNINLSRICRLYQDSHGTIWMAERSGLHRIDLEKTEILNYSLFENIDYPEAWSILEDNRDNLWIGTHFGLCRFNTKTGQVKNFTQEDGVPISIHEYNSAFKDKDSRLYFGGSGGFYSFHPDSIKTNPYIPPVVITDFRLFNKSVHVDTSKKAILIKNIAYTNLIELQYYQNDLSFEFAALDYTLPLRNQYAYKLEGYQDNWIEADAKNRIATYTNLDPGTYTFRVKGSNNDGVWNEEGTSLTIIIHKPWWGTTLAWCIYVLVFLGAIGGYMRWRLWRLKKEKLELERQIHERTQQIEEQKDLLEQQNQQITEHEQLKSRFFTNVSHEFRTPLSLIQSPVEELLDDPHRSDKERRKLNMVHRNARRLLNLVNQLLDISKIDGSKMKLELIQDDAMKHLRAIAGAFTSLAETKKINYQRHFPTEETISWFDPDKLEKIAGNILSNAFKFTPGGGEIIFTALYRNSNDHRIDRILEFSVKDNGPGIPSGSLEKIFDRFYQVEESMKTEGGGTGIGLSLARDMARLLHGDIGVESEPGKGSTFTVSIPLDKDHLKESEFILLKEAPDTVVFIPEHHNNMEEAILQHEGISKDVKPVILIVEDNRDIRIQLADNLNREYSIVEAIDGVFGLEKATEIIPDLVITDLMMPRMDGIELCNKLKNDERTSHIPVIMLTAKVTLEDKVTGFLTGADDYIPKPFQMAELKARVVNLIEQRKKLRERFSHEVTLQPSDISITPLDEKFLNRAIEIVEKHMHEETFDLPKFREEMNMSGSTLFRKLHALTDQSPTEFISTIRLKRSASLLKQNFGNVTQVSLEVGFSNVSYFIKSFRELFGVPPLEYKNSTELGKRPNQ